MKKRIVIMLVATVFLSGAGVADDTSGHVPDLLYSESQTKSVKIRCGGEYDEDTKTITPNSRDICKLTTCMTSYTAGVCGELVEKIVEAGGAKLCLHLGAESSCVDITED